MLKDALMTKFGLIPETLIILGSGTNDFVEYLEDVESLPYVDVFNVETDPKIGHKGLLHLGFLESVPLLVMEGRKHYYEGTSDQEIRDVIHLMAKTGIKNMVVTNACGGMNESFKPGDIMIIEDHINMMGRNPMVGKNDFSIGERFFDMSEPYDLEFRKIIDQIAIKENVKLQHGIYVSYLGPSFETKAEIRAFKLLGGDVVGMSTVPEVIVARHAGIRILGVSIITNMSTGITETAITHEENLKIGGKVVEKLAKLLKGFVKEIADV